MKINEIEKYEWKSIMEDPKLRSLATKVFCVMATSEDDCLNDFLGFDLGYSEKYETVKKLLSAVFEFCKQKNIKIAHLVTDGAKGYRKFENKNADKYGFLPWACYLHLTKIAKMHVQKQ